MFNSIHRKHSILIDCLIEMIQYNENCDFKHRSVTIHQKKIQHWTSILYNSSEKVQFWTTDLFDMVDGMNIPMQMKPE